jgi:hypothetical protein
MVVVLLSQLPPFGWVQASPFPSTVFKIQNIE